MARQCVYCDNSGTTLEHAWPKWLLRWWNPSGQPVPTQRATPDGTKPIGGWNFGAIRTVCGPCNRWMQHTFEDHVAPLIKHLDDGPPETTITPEQQRLLASWVFKTLLMLECTMPMGLDEMRPACRRFRSSGLPPDNVSIVMGITLEPALAFHRETMTHRGPERPSNIVDGFAATMVVSHLFFHVIGDTPVLNAHEVVTPAALRDCYHRIWPATSRPLLYPFASAFTKGALEDLIRWTGGETGFTFLPVGSH